MSCIHMSCIQYAVKTMLLTAVLLAAITSTCAAQVFDEQFDHWPLDLKINGKVIVAGATVITRDHDAGDDLV